MRILRTVLLAVLLLPPIQSGAAEDPVARGQNIAREAERRDQGYRDMSANMTMILQDRKGNTSERRLHISTLEVPDPQRGDRSVVVFDAPSDLKGTAFLSHAGILQDDDQWLYLPGLKRTKRISSGNKTGAFFGSEFAYEDIADTEVGRFSYRWLENKPCGRLTCFVVERKPLYKNSGYSRLITWFDTAHYRVWRIDYFDRKDAPFKTLTLANYRQYKGRFWRPRSHRMNNLKTGKTTLLTYDNYRFGTGLSAAQFTKGNLRNAR